MRIPALVACFLALAACAPEAEVEAPPPSASRSDVETRTAIVESVDEVTREIVLSSERGTLVVRAGDEVRNFDQITPGDSVHVTYYEAVAARMAEPGEEIQMTEATAIGRAPEGAKPGVTTGTVIEAVVEFVGYDSVTHTAVYRDPEGRLREANVQPELRAFAEGLTAGDIVAVHIERAVAISVEPIS